MNRKWKWALVSLAFALGNTLFALLKVAEITSGDFGTDTLLAFTFSVFCIGFCIALGFVHGTR